MTGCGTVPPDGMTPELVAEFMTFTVLIFFSPIAID